jgi:hypothetical protein
MTYSKIHQAFSERLKKPDALKNPEKYLGPNYQDVLNFWIYVDTLSNKEKEEMDQSYWALDEEVRDSAINTARDAADDVVGWGFRNAAWCAVWDVTGLRLVFVDATLELIGHHKLLEQGKTPLALPLCVKS